MSEIRPAAELVVTHHPNTDVCADPHVDEIAKEDVIRTNKDIRAKSKAITDLEAEGKLMGVGATYDFSTGKVSLLEI